MPSAIFTTGKTALLAVLASACLAHAQGIIKTVAGNGTPGFLGDGGPATSAEVNFTTSTASGTLGNSTGNPKGVAVDAAGNIYIADYGNERIRKVLTNGNITSIAGNGIAGFSGDGGPATVAAICTPEGIWVDSSGNVYIADQDGYARRVNSRGTINTLAGNGAQDYSGDGGLATNAGLYWPSGVATDAAGNLYIADTQNNRIRKVTPGGTISTLAGTGMPGYSGDGGPAKAAELDWPAAVAVDSAGNVYFADLYNGAIRKITVGGTITTVAGGGFYLPSNGMLAAQAFISNPSGVAVDSAGNIYYSDSGDNLIVQVNSAGLLTIVAGNGSQGFSGDNGPATSAALNFPSGVTVDSAGNVYFADNGNNRVREIVMPPAPVVTSGGIVPIYSSATTIQPGEWVSIYGTGFASSPVTWGGDFPTSLGNVSVTINGKFAYLLLVSATQIDLQAPDDSTTGPVPVVVITPSGSATSTVTLGQFAPSFCVAGGKYVAGIIVRTDGSGAQGGGTYDFLGPAGNSLGYPTTPARAGDNIELFGVGFGPTNPPIPSGSVVPAGSYGTATSSINVLINAVGVTPTFAGITEAGLFQFNLTVPAGLGSGDVPLLATAGGLQTPAGFVISLQ